MEFASPQHRTKSIHRSLPSTVVALGLCAVILGCRQEPPSDPTLLARVGTQEVRVADFNEWLQRQGAKGHGVAPETLLQQFLDHVAMLEYSKSIGLDKEPEFRRAYENLLLSRLRARELEPALSNAVPSTVQIETHYQTNQAAFTDPAQRNGAILFLEVSSKATPEKRAQVRTKMEEARVKALELIQSNPAIRGFGPLAIEYSEDQPTRYRGGDIGWVDERRRDGRYDAPVIEALFHLEKPGQISEVLETPKGFYLVRLLESRDRRVKPLASVEPVIRHKLQIAGRERVEKEWRIKTASGIQREMAPDALKKLPELPQPQRAPDAQPPGLPSQ